MKIYFKDQDQREEMLDVEANDNSYRNRAVMGEHSLTLYFSLPESLQDHLRIVGGLPVGAWCDFQGQRYTLEKPENFKMHNPHNFEYTLVMEGTQAALKKYMFRNKVDNRLKFSVTFQPKEHLQMLIDNLELRDPEWKLGECIHASAKTIAYNHTDCFSALNQMAQEFDTEWEIDGKTIHLRKAEYNKWVNGQATPLPLSYGRGNGLKPGVGRTNFSDSNPIEILYVQGGEKNIDPSVYGNKELLLPRNGRIMYDGEHFEDEPGFSFTQAQTYEADEQGLCLMRVDGQRTGAEGSLDLSHIYPHRVGTISQVIPVDADKNFYDFVDSSIPQDMDYSKYLTKGEKMTVVFQSGMLAGKEFDVKYVHEANGDKVGRRFEIVPQEIDGFMMPGGSFVPKVGIDADTYSVFGVMLADAYIRSDDPHRSGAEWDMMREGVKYLCDNQVQKFSFTGELDGIWAKKNWLEVGGKIRLGGYVLFSDERFQREPVLIRIVGIKDMINNPYSPEIELSNKPISASFLANTVSKVDSQEVVLEQKHSEALQFTKRRFRDAQQTSKMLEESLLDFSSSVNPITVKTMQLLLGDETLQYQFVESQNNPVVVDHQAIYSDQTKKLTIPGGTLQHLTLGVDLMAQNKPGDYLFWDIKAYGPLALADPNQSYYIYVKCEKSGPNGSFLVSPTAMSIDSVQGYYYLLYGTLGEEIQGHRSLVSWYGFAELTPGRFTIPMIVSPDGKTYFDVAKGRIGGNIEFITKENTTKTLISGGKIVSDAIDANTIKVGNKTLITNGKLTTELINADMLEARIVNTRAKNVQGQHIGTGVEISPEHDTVKIYDKDGGIRIVLQGGVSDVGGQASVGIRNNNNLYEQSSLLSQALILRSTNGHTVLDRYGLEFTGKNQNGLNEVQVSVSKSGIKLPPNSRIDMPGVLCAGQIGKNGAIVGKSWGCITPTITKYNGIAGKYKITHKLGHLDYYVNATPVGKDETWMKVHCVTTDKTTNYCVIGVYDSGQGNVTVDYKVDFMIVGQNI